MENINIKQLALHEYKLKHSAKVATNNINSSSGRAVVSLRSMQRMFKQFRNGDFCIESRAKGRPQNKLDETILREFVNENCKLSTRAIALHFNVDHTTICRNLKAINMKKKMDKWVPHCIDARQKLARLTACKMHLSRLRTEHFLHKVITCDEKWILYDNVTRTASWVDANSPPQKMPKPNLHAKKLMILVFWNMRGLIHLCFLKQGQTIDSEFYREQLCVVREKLVAKQPALVNRHGVILLHGNARPHVAAETKQTIAELGFETLLHPPYSPDLSPTDYHIFKHLNAYLSGKVFKEKEDIENAVSTFFSSRDASFFKRGTYKLVDNWSKCVDAKGDYFD